MKILMVSIFAPHFFNWTEQLRESGHEVYWLDVYDSNTKVEKIDFVHQIIGWRYKFDYPGRYFIKKNIPKLNKLINKINERRLSEVFEKTLLEIKPNVVQSFVMYSACVPLYNVMNKYPKVQWIYSAWGNDLYFYQNENQELQDMKRVLPILDYMFADCERDYKIAKKYGFQGEFIGVFPGGGGYDFGSYNPYIKPFSQRKIILIKGYQHKFGRCNKVLEAIITLKEQLSSYQIVVFAANKSVLDFSKQKQLNNWENLTIYGQLSHYEVLRLMGESQIYIGNSISDGMPNTLLEAIIMGAFPIQSNPGGATEELIINGENGFIIEYPEDIVEIANQIERAIVNPEFIIKAIEYNLSNIKPMLERNYIQKKVLEKYKLVEQDLKALKW